jgi:hemolysin III
MMPIISPDGLMKESDRQDYNTSSGSFRTELMNPDDQVGVQEEGGDWYWQFTDFGMLGERSRDGSIHVTDEVFNSASHLAATMMSVLGTALLISSASALGAPWKIVSFSIYGCSLIFLFGASTLHHSISTTPKWEHHFKMLDYLAIYPLIAGTFTPLCLVYFHDSVIGWCFFAVVWTLSLLSMYLTASLFHKVPKWLTMTQYITLGWLGAFMVHWLIDPNVMGLGGVSLLVIGGILYTAGGYVYVTESPNPYPGRFGFHEIWHVAVILAAAMHWCMMYSYVLPYQK